MNKIVYGAKNNFYKGNLHCHSTISDGNLSVDELVELYKNNGYSFLCLSEHDVYTDYRDSYNCDDFILLPGVERSLNIVDNDNNNNIVKTHHFHGIAANLENEKICSSFKHFHKFKVSVLSENENIQNELNKNIKELLDDGMLVTYNHPIWSNVEPRDLPVNNDIWAIEIYNYNTCNECGLGYDEVFWDYYLKNIGSTYAFASDDNHNNGQFDDSFGGFIVVNADNLSEVDIINALKEGNFYSSTGAVINKIEIENNNIVLEGENLEYVDVVVNNRVGCGKRIYTSKDCIKYKLKGFEKYVRFRCKDNNGNVAWSNPIFLGELYENN